jgi:hypothetical protein
MSSGYWRTNARLAREVVRRFGLVLLAAGREWGLLPVGKVRRDHSFFERELHDWRRIPFWHPDRWADGSGWRCKGCGVYRANMPTRFTAWAFLLWRVLAALLVLNGLLALLFGWR